VIGPCRAAVLARLLDERGRETYVRLRRHSPSRVTRARWLAVAVAVALGAAAAAGLAVSQNSPPPSVVREVLGSGLPGSAPGQRLELVRFTIAPGTALAPHRHPGMQVVSVESGILGYTVLEGRIRIRRADGTIEVLEPGREAVVAPGEWFVETSDLEHFGRNPGAEPLVILVSSLLDRHLPPSIPVTQQAESRRP